LQWNAYVPGFAGAVNVVVDRLLTVTLNPPWSAVTVCVIGSLFDTVTVLPGATGTDVKTKFSMVTSALVAEPPEQADSPTSKSTAATTAMHRCCIAREYGARARSVQSNISLRALNHRDGASVPVACTWGKGDSP